MSLAEIHKKAKLVMIPSGFKADEILYSVLPNDGSGNFTASGDTDSTRVNKDGLIEKVTTLVPRLNYDFGNPKNPHLLLESQRTNKLGYSEDFSNAYWTKTNINTSSSNFNVTTSPDGSINADKLVPDTTSGQHKIDRTETVTNGATVALSVFVKKAEYEFCCLYEVNSSKGKFFDLSNGTIGGDFVGTPTTSKIESLDNDWFRVSLTTTVPSTSARWILYVCDTISNTSFAGDNSKGIFVWGTQLEEGAFETTYIPATSTAGVTRSQDTCTGGGSSSIFNDSEGTLFLEISRPINDSTTRSISISDGGSSDRVIIQYISGFILGIVASETTTVATLLFSTTSTSLNKIALRYKKNDFAMYVNGTQAGTDTSGNAPVGLSSFDFNDGTGSQKYEGQCAQAMYFDTALTNAELTTLTT